MTAFAESFGHKINPARRTVMLVDENEVSIGYFQLIETPVFMVALHPELAKGRASIEAIKKMQAWSEMQYGEALAGVNPGSPFEEVLPRLDFKEMPLKLFKS